MSFEGLLRDFGLATAGLLGPVSQLITHTHTPQQWKNCVPSPSNISNLWQSLLTNTGYRFITYTLCTLCVHILHMMRCRNFHRFQLVYIHITETAIAALQEHGSPDCMRKMKVNINMSYSLCQNILHQLIIIHACI